MSFKTTASYLATGLALSLAWATIAQAQVATYSLSGNTRSQIGAGLPLPITFQPAPNGKIVIVPGATVMQTAGPDPKAMTFSPGQVAFGPVTFTAPVAPFNPVVLQVKTSLIVDGPIAQTSMGGPLITSMGPVLGTAMFSAGGRSGPAIFTWCPGLPLPTASFNPSCSPATTATLITPTPALQNMSLRYEATGAQFGGISQASVGGGADVVLRAGMPAFPCKATAVGGTATQCSAAFSVVSVNSVAAGGAPLGFKLSTIPAPSPGNIHPIGVLGGGTVTAVGATPNGTFPKNNVLNYGAPWTTGKVTIRAPLAAGGAETFFLQGADNRVDGIGSISLVSGGLSSRSLSGDNANRTWQNLVVSPFSVPSISDGGLILLGAILLASTMWMVRRAVVTSH